MSFLKSKFVASISVNIELPEVEFNTKRNTFTFTYVLKRNFLGKPKCICNKKSVKYDRSDNPTGPGSYWRECKYTSLKVYQKYIWAWLKGDYTALAKYYTDNNQEIPDTVIKDMVWYENKYGVTNVRSKT